MFKYLYGVFSYDMAIDLGTANTLISVKNRGIVINEPSVVAVKKYLNSSNKIVSIGKKAKEMIGKNPDNIEIIRPIKDGVISDFEITKEMIKYFIYKTHYRTYFVSPRIIISIPYGLTALEKTSVIEASKEAGAREVYLMEELIAAAIGADIDISRAEGHLIVDIGGGTTEIGVISLGGLVASKSIRIAGDRLDSAIADFIKEKFNIEISTNIAESIKIAISNALFEYEKKSIKVTGKSIFNQTPSTITITSQDIYQAITPVLQDIIDAIKRVIEHSPLDIASDIIDNGILLTGGGALIKNLDRLISQRLKLKANITYMPLLSVARGTAKALENIEYLKELERY